MAATSEQSLAWIELSAGDAGAALACLLRADAILAESGERSLRSTTQAMVARSYELLGRDDSAQAAIELAEQLSAPQEAINYAITHDVRARLALHAGDEDVALTWARSAVDQALKTDFVDLQGGARLGLAAVLAARGRADGASSEARAALQLFEAKGDRPGADAARALLERL